MNAIGHRGLPVDDKRELLLDSAERVFCRAGYAGTTMAALAAEAGVTRPTIYAYYPSKDEVFRALAQRVRAELLDLQERADVTSPRDTLRGTLTESLNAYVRHHGMVTVIAHQALVDPSIRSLQEEIYDRANRRHTRYIERLVAAGVADPPVAPAMLAEIVTGMTMRFADLAAADPARQTELTEALVEAYWRLAGME
ncbi:TetR/AcrR family transcriptional regulator [Gordonia sp. CPCC 205515]|uniref:TetR/AcrR family transcriptional regulator n=1 Tax=Gordonia sp. CPCC 205515 TaxID=3140791 RepID=UPI003AF35194